MATITSATSGNFSAGATWVGGVVPGPADDAVVATGHTVTIDTNVTVLSFQQAGTGKFVLGGGRTVSGNVIANAGTYNTGGATVEVTASFGTTATINGNITGTGSTGQFSCGVLISGLGTFILNGNVTGFSGNLGATVGAPAIYTNVNSSITINGNLIAATGNLKVCVFIDAASSATLTINGNIIGGSSGVGTIVQVNGVSPLVYVVGNITAAASAGMSVGSTSPSINVTGNVSGGFGSNAHGINFATTSGTLNVVGNVTGGNANNLRGILVSSNAAVVNVTGTITGLSNANADGIALSGTTSTLFATGNFNAGSGGSGVFASAIFASGASITINAVGTATANGFLSPAITSSSTTTNTGVIFQGDMIDGSGGAVAIHTRMMRLTATSSGYNRHQNTVGFPNGTPVFRVSPDQVTGMPTPNNVRAGLSYGYNNLFTGTVAIPPVGSVALGAQVDNTTGTAALDAGTVIAVVGQQVAAASSSPSVV